VRLQPAEGLRRRGRADARQQLQAAERGDAVARVVGPAQHGQQVLDVRRLEELQPAVLHERDVAPHQLELQPVAVVAGAEQHRLVAQQLAGLARGEDRR
jgi:hypothetical protein